MRKNVFDEPEKRKVKGTNPFDLLAEYIYCSLHCSHCNETLMHPVAINTREQPWANQIDSLIQHKIAKHVCKDGNKLPVPEEKQKWDMPAIQKRLDEIYCDRDTLTATDPSEITLIDAPPFKIGMTIINIKTGSLFTIKTEDQLSKAIDYYINGNRDVKPYI